MPEESNPKTSPPKTSFPGLAEICQLIANSVDWKTSLDQILPYIRRLVIFDNFALYQSQPNNDSFEVVYARATGRGKSIGEDLSWGDATATLIFESHQPEINQPIHGTNDTDQRIDFPYIIGLPIKQGNKEYAMILIRFGGPEYTAADRQALTMVSSVMNVLLKVKTYQDQLRDLEHERLQATLQEDFISTISHELLSPIGFIKGYTTTLLRPDTTWNQDMQLEFLSIINDETDRLQELIDNLLDSARLSTGSLSMEHQPVRLDALIRDVTMRAVVHQINIQIDNRVKHQLPPIVGDARRLTQVFENILSNTIKYAPGSKLIIDAENLKNKIHLTFADNGPGISAKFIPNLFKKYYRSPDNSTQIRGTGLGLFICRQIVEAHGGEIFIESEMGRGTSVHIVLPVDMDYTSQGAS